MPKKTSTSGQTPHDAGAQKPLLPRPIPPMRDTPPWLQEELQERHQVRAEVRDAIKQLRAVLKEWVDDVVMDAQRFEAFHASGHQGEYLVFPEQTLADKLTKLGWTKEQIDALTTIQTPMDLMDTEELRAVLQRITLMRQWFRSQSQGGPFQRACDIYEAMGSLVRRLITQQTGHAPEDFPVPDVIIRGDKEEARRVHPTPYRASLFDPMPSKEKPS